MTSRSLDSIFGLEPGGLARVAHSSQRLEGVKTFTTFAPEVCDGAAGPGATPGFGEKHEQKQVQWKDEPHFTSKWL